MASDTTVSVKLDAEQLTTILEKILGQDETIAELKGVMQLDKLDGERAIVLIANEDKTLTLKAIPLP